MTRILTLCDFIEFMNQVSTVGYGDAIPRTRLEQLTPLIGILYVVFLFVILPQLIVFFTGS